MEIYSPHGFSASHTKPLPLNKQSDSWSRKWLLDIQSYKMVTGNWSSIEEDKNWKLDNVNNFNLENESPAVSAAARGSPSGAGGWWYKGTAGEDRYEDELVNEDTKVMRGKIGTKTTWR